MNMYEFKNLRLRIQAGFGNGGKSCAWELANGQNGDESDPPIEN
ncbi:MAG: hypothetical protein R3A44_05685 [Caldilineaceae bacterium]